MAGLREFCKPFLAAADSQSDMAEQAMDALLANRRKHATLIREAIRLGVDHVFYHLRFERNAEGKRAALRLPEPGPAARTADAAQRAALRTGGGRYKSILDTFCTADGTMLGDLDREALSQIIDYHRSEVIGHGRMVAFFDAILGRVDAGKTVRECIEPAEADELMRQSRD